MNGRLATRWSLCLVLAAAVALTAIGIPAATGGTAQTVDVEAVDRVEDRSEALANDLLDLSVAARDLDLSAMSSYFARQPAATPLPTRPAPLQPVAEGILEHGWTGSSGETDRAGGSGESGGAGVFGKPVRTSRDELLDGLASILSHFSELDDVRFKVKRADFDPGGALEGNARVFLFAVGRDLDGRREWLRGWLRIEARAEAEGPWRIARLELESLESMVAADDLFSEVTLPAGVEARFPPFGRSPNDAVVAHGVAVADVDSDGLLDAVTTGVERNVLYLNDGRGGFEDVSAAAGIDVTPRATGPLFVDVDNDGDRDLFLAAVGEQMLLENRLVPDGELRFQDRSLEAGVAVPAVGFSAAAADVNGDGFQDIYVSSYNRYGVVMPDAWHRATNGTPNLLFLNRGDGTFREAAAEWGVRDGRWSYAAAFADVDADGDQDLYVSNDFGENGFYRNEGDRFVEMAAEAGILDPGNGMGVSFGDVDNDGDLDLHVTNMSSTAGNRILARLYPDASPDDLVLKKLASGNSLYENDGTGHFRDVTRQRGPFSAGWAFGGGFLDVDNDGREDIYSPNGFISGKTMDDT